MRGSVAGGMEVLAHTRDLKLHHTMCLLSREVTMIMIKSLWWLFLSDKDLLTVYFFFPNIYSEYTKDQLLE